MERSHATDGIADHRVEMGFYVIIIQKGICPENNTMHSIPMHQN